MKKIILLLLGCTWTYCCLAQSFRGDEAALRKLTIAQLAISNLYVDSVNDAKLVEDAIQGMLKNLDPHSSYTNAEETKRMNEPLQGNFEGIGVQFNMIDDSLVVIQTVKGGPSEKVGILAGDRIVAVDDTIIAGVKMDRMDIMKKLRGPKNTEANLTIIRRGVKKPLHFVVRRDKIPVQSLDAAFMLTPTTGLIRFDHFGETTHKEFVKALKQLQEKGLQNLILDLQANGGGYLGAAIAIANEFLHQDQLVVYTQGRSQPYADYKARGGGIFQKGKLIILVDEFSASASEIVAGAIQDQDRGMIVGRRTFGKGLVQRPIDLPDGSMIRLTVAHYYTPSGRCIQKPYVKGEKEAYERDLLDRLSHGELTNRDSIHINDSTTFRTLVKHRTVYGGGGITPDYFVPLDTTRYTPYYRALLRSNIVPNQILKYSDENGKKLHSLYSSFHKYLAQFQVPELLIKQIITAGEKDSIKAKDEAEYEKTIQLLTTFIKAMVARNLWDSSEYFQIIYADDPIVRKALDIIEKK